MVSNSSGLKWQAAVAAIACLLMAGCLMPACRAQDPSIPHLRRRGATTPIIVDEKPLLLPGGEPQVRLNGYPLNVTCEAPSSGVLSGRLVVAVEPDKFLLTGTHLVIT